MRHLSFLSLLLFASPVFAQVSIDDKHIILNSGQTLEQAIATGALGGEYRSLLEVTGCNGTAATLLWDTTAGFNPEAICDAGIVNTGLILGAATFDDVTLERMQRVLTLPTVWASGTATLTLSWHAASTTNETRWCARVACFTTGEYRDVAWDTAVCADDTTAGVANATNAVVLSFSGTTIDTCAATELMRLELYRDAAHANDDMAGLAYLDSVEVKF